MKDKYKINVCLGIRPDAIRSSVILKKMEAHPRIDLQLVWSGQHWDHNLMGVFFDEMGITRPSVVLECGGGSHYSQHSRLIQGLGDVLEKDRPDVCLFLGDANAVMGCIAPLKMGIPIAHVEAGNRSFDWSMPEERNRVVIDRVSDILFAYHENSKNNLIREGVNPEKIVVCGNTIVDVLLAYTKDIDNCDVLHKLGLEPKRYAIQTLHRDEHMNNSTYCVDLLCRVDNWAGGRNIKVVLPIMPRLKKIVDESNLNLSNFIITKPLGFFEFCKLEKNALVEFTDSGTNQETSGLHGTPCVVTRMCTERPETFDSNIIELEHLNIDCMAEIVLNRTPNKDYSLGSGNSADIIIKHLVKFLEYGPNKNPWMDKTVMKHWGMV